jgi:hypothetical protein
MAYIISPFQIISLKGKPPFDICQHGCLNAVKTTYYPRRASAWERLPQMFGLPAWNELRQSAKGVDIVGNMDAMDESEADE